MSLALLIREGVEGVERGLRQEDIDPQMGSDDLALWIWPGARLIRCMAPRRATFGRQEPVFVMPGYGPAAGHLRAHYLRASGLSATRTFAGWWFGTPEGSISGPLRGHSIAPDDKRLGVDRQHFSG